MPKPKVPKSECKNCVYFEKMPLKHDKTLNGSKKTGGNCSNLNQMREYVNGSDSCEFFHPNR